MVRVTGLVIGVLDDSPFSDFVVDLIICLLGAMDVSEWEMRLIHYKRSIVQCICTSINIDWTT